MHELRVMQVKWDENRGRDFWQPMHRVCSADFSVLCQSGKLRSLSSNAVSGEAFQGVTPSFHFSEYQLGEAGFSLLFPLLLPPAQLKFICSNVSLHVGCNDSLFEALAPYFSPKKENTSITCSAGYYLSVHGTTPDSIVFSHFLWVLARRGEF